MSVAIYPGSFDPITIGHLDIVARAAYLFDELIVAVFDTPDKRLMFSTEERVELVAKSVAHLPNVRTVKYSGLTVDCARQMGAKVIVRGLRAVSDFIREFEMALMNKRQSSEVESIFLMASDRHQFLSASLIKEVAMLHGHVEEMVPPPVLVALRARLDSSPLAS